MTIGLEACLHRCVVDGKLTAVRRVFTVCGVRIHTGDAIDQQTQGDIGDGGASTVSRVYKNEHGVDVHLLRVGAAHSGCLPVLVLDVEKLIAALSRVRGGWHGGHRTSATTGTSGTSVTGSTAALSSSPPNGSTRNSAGALVAGHQSRTRHMLRMVSSILLHWNGHTGEVIAGDGTIPKEVLAYANLKLRHRPGNYTFGLVDGKHNIFSVALPIPNEDQGTRRWCVLVDLLV